MKQTVEGQIIDIQHRTIFEGSIEIENGIISKINPHETKEKSYIIPGFVDAHIHIESSMLTPENFGRQVIKHGTVAVVTDPHEIGNVMGVAGVQFMLKNSRKSPVKCFFSIPSCVPATPFDVSGGVISSKDVEEMASSNQFVALSEMMNVPGVLFEDKEVMAKLACAKRHSLPIDGHSPGLLGEQLKKYVNSGISTDHECSTLKEAQEKLALGMKILIREGSAARNYEALKTLIKTNPDNVMFCTDDSHPDELIESGHIDKLVRRAIADGFDLFDVLKIASINSILHYKLDVGTLKIGDKADFIIINDLKQFKVQKAFVNGKKQYDIDEADNWKVKTESITDVNAFNHNKIATADLKKAVGDKVTVISLTDGELLTAPYTFCPDKPVENFESDVKNDILKIVYLNRYQNGKPQIAFCKGFELKHGAFASSVAHDSHNIIAVGCSDREIAGAINQIIEERGGLSVQLNDKAYILPLPIGGIMSDKDGKTVSTVYKSLYNKVNEMGCNLRAPFMTLAFMSLLVIPEIKIGEKGLFSYSKFYWIE